MVIVASMLAAEHVFTSNRAPGDRAYPNSAAPPGRDPPGPTPALRALIEEGLGDHVLLLRLFLAWDSPGGGHSWPQSTHSRCTAALPYHYSSNINNAIPPLYFPLPPDDGWNYLKDITADLSHRTQTLS
uniref:Uncharacterized protein n=1 Tax=Tetraselmis chuii TaxID=63592 RepID=A0A7S1T0N6_9CHLO